MFEDEIEDDELDGEASADLDLDEADAEFAAADDGALDDIAVDDDNEEDAGRAPVRSKAKVAAAEEELLSVEAKRKERDELAEAMAAFLARGGKIQAVESLED